MQYCYKILVTQREWFHLWTALKSPYCLSKLPKGSQYSHQRFNNVLFRIGRDVSQGDAEMISTQVTELESRLLVTEISGVSSFRVPDLANAVLDAGRIHKRNWNVLTCSGSPVFHSGNLELALGSRTVGKQDSLHLWENGRRITVDFVQDEVEKFTST